MLAERKRSRFKPTAQPDREIDGFCEIELPRQAIPFDLETARQPAKGVSPP
jgi:hypothetical protein